MVVASPPNTHVRFLNKALTSRTHALCEKPIGWEDGPSKELDTLVHAFHAAELHLAVHAQWPFTLPTYRALYPDVTLDRAKSFAMILCPRAPGLAGLVDSLSHPLSVLVDEIRITVDDQGFIRVRFAYCGAGRRIGADVHLVPDRIVPRPAAYGFDDAVAAREVEMPAYAMSLRAGGSRRIPLPDPSRLLVGSLLDRIAAGPPDAVDPAIALGMRHLEEIWRVARHVEFPESP